MLDEIDLNTDSVSPDKIFRMFRQIWSFSVRCFPFFGPLAILPTWNKASNVQIKTDVKACDSNLAFVYKTLTEEVINEKKV